MYQYEASDSPSPSKISASGQMHSPMSMSVSSPPGWAPYIQYYPGHTVYYDGTYWRCEVPHSSGPEHMSAPTQNLNIWTPLSSVGLPNQQYGYHQSIPQDMQYPAGPSSSSSGYTNTNIYSPVPLPMPTGPPSPPAERDDSPSSSCSDDTVKSPSTGQIDKSMPSSVGGGRGQASNSSVQNRFSHVLNRAGDSLRFLTLQEESRKARDKSELRDEAGGKRIWRVGGIGIWSYSLDPAEERVKREVWSRWAKEHDRAKWLEVARKRTDFYNRESKGVKPLYMWKLIEGGGRSFPHDALPIGREEDGQILYVARTWHEGGLHPGKAAPHLPNGLSIPYGGAELTYDAYEILCGPGDPALLKWMTFRHGECVQVDGWQPVEGGREADGTALLLAKGLWENGDHPGKCAVDGDHACVGWGGGEAWVRPYQILAYSTSNRR